MTTQSPSDARIEEIRQRAEKATPGPWSVRIDDFVVRLKIGTQERHSVEFNYGSHANNIPSFGTAAEAEANAEFASHAREDIPYLLAENARQAAELDRLKAERDDEWAKVRNAWGLALLNYAIGRFLDLAKGVGPDQLNMADVLRDFTAQYEGKEG